MTKNTNNIVYDKDEFRNLRNKLNIKSLDLTNIENQIIGLEKKLNGLIEKIENYKKYKSEKDSVLKPRKEEVELELIDIKARLEAL